MAFLEYSILSNMGFAQLGNNVLISDKASIYNPEKIFLGSNIRIDDFCILSAGDGGIEVKNFIHIAAYSSLIGKGKILLEDFCNISSRVSIYSSSDDYSGNSLTNPMVPEKFKNVIHGNVILNKHVIVGAGAVILPNVTIGIGTSIGALSLINKCCDSFSVYGGIPAKKIGIRNNRILSIEKMFLDASK